MTGASVSVVVPVRDPGPWLAETLASIARQTAPPLETLVIDDGNHPPLSLDGIAPARTRVIRQPHRGVSAARNAGLAAARGSLITFIDADDLWLPHSLATLLAARHARDTDASVQGRIQRFSAAPGAPPSILGTPFHGYNMGAFLFRRAALERIGGFDPRIALGEDFEILVRFQAAGYRRGLVEDTVLLYRRGHGSTTERAGVDNDGLDALRSKATFLAAHLARRRRSQ